MPLDPLFLLRALYPARRCLVPLSPACVALPHDGLGWQGGSRVPEILELQKQVAGLCPAGRGGLGRGDASSVNGARPPRPGPRLLSALDRPSSSVSARFGDLIF